MRTNEEQFQTKAYFPGPASENESWLRGVFGSILDDWFNWRSNARPDDATVITPEERLKAAYGHEREVMAQALNDLLHSLHRETPTHSPRYLGHMVSELTIPALTGHFAALLHNPNNTSKEVSCVGTVIEAEAISMLADMVGFNSELAEGHFTSCGTIANFEAVWRARFRLDHWLSMALHISESNGDVLNPFNAAHMGWSNYHKIRKLIGVEESELRAASAVAGNPANVYRRISKAAGIEYEGPVVLVPGNKHYSWRKAANLFGMGEEAFWSVDLDEDGRLDITDLERKTELAAEKQRPILMIVSVAGTTETGEIDPIDLIANRLDQWEQEREWRIWHHVDAAFGGFFCTMTEDQEDITLDEKAINSLRAIKRADSITIDPHKLGYVPYACGAFITADSERYAVSSFAAPYLERTGISNDKWACTIEGSRTATGAAAVWLTGKTLGFRNGRFGNILTGTVTSRELFATALQIAIPEVQCLEPADTNILCFSIGDAGASLRESNFRTQKIYDAIAADQDFWVSTTTLTKADYSKLIDRHVQGYGGTVDDDHLILIRCVFMNPYWSSTEVRSQLIPAFVDKLRGVISSEDSSSCNTDSYSRGAQSFGP